MTDDSNSADVARLLTEIRDGQMLQIARQEETLPIALGLVLVVLALLAWVLLRYLR